MSYYNSFAFAAFLLFIIFRRHIERSQLFQKFALSSGTFNKIKPVLFILICVFALFSRIYNFPSLPMGINQDEAMAAIDAKSLLAYGTDHTGLKFPVYLPAWGTSQMNLLGPLLMVPSIAAFGMGIFAVRLPSLVVALASIIVAYCFVKRLFGKGAAASCAFLLSICPWHVMVSRWGLESNIFPACALAAFYFMYRGASEKKAIYLYISMLFWCASMYAYGIAYFAVPFILAASAAYFLKGKIIGVKTFIICFAAYIVISAPVFLMACVNLFKLPTIELGFMTIPYFPRAVRMSDMIFGAGDAVDQLRNNILFIFRNLFQYPDVWWNMLPEYGTLYIFSLPLTVYGYIKMYGYWKAGQNRAAATESGTPKAAESGAIVPKAAESGAIMSKAIESGAIVPKAAESGAIVPNAAFFIVNVWLAAALLTGIIINTAGTNQINILFFPLIILCSIGLEGVCRSVIETPDLDPGASCAQDPGAPCAQDPGAPYASAHTGDACNGQLCGIPPAPTASAPRVYVNLLPAAVFAVAFALFVSAYQGKFAENGYYRFYDGFGESVVAADNSGCGRVYVTNWTQHENSPHVSEVLTLYYCGIDSMYYRGEAEGREGQDAPYSERYRYVRFEETPAYDPSAAYVINVGGDASLFPEDKFEVTRHGSFAVARWIMA